MENFPSSLSSKISSECSDIKCSDMSNSCFIERSSVFLMNTDASNVEDKNIHQIIERLSMSCIESSGERSNIFRNRSCPLFKNERHFRERLDSAAVSESISSSMTNLSCTGLTVHVFDISPDFHSREDHFSLVFHSE